MRTPARRGANIGVAYCEGTEFGCGDSFVADNIGIAAVLVMRSDVNVDPACTHINSFRT